MNIRRLRLLTIVLPVAFLLGLEIVSIFYLRPALGNNSGLRLFVVFGILAVAVVPFAYWVFATIERQQHDLERRNRQLDAIDTAIRSISGPLELDQVLQTITDAARSLVHSRYAALGVADDAGRILRFITAGITPDQRAAIGPLPVGHGLLGVLIREGKPLRIPEIAQDPNSHGFPPNHPPMKSLLGVPILFKDKPVGDLYLTDKIGADEFSADDQELLMLLANHAAIAIENARLYEDARTARDRLQSWNEQLEAIVAERTHEIEQTTKQMTTRVLQAQEDERKRIARELHDETAQSLSTMLITLDLYEPFLPDDNAPLRTGFDRIRELARRTLDETRALSHDLRPTILDDVGLVAALHWYADEHRHTFGVPVQVHVKAVDEARLSPEQEIALFRIAQEALNNSGKYAQASEACISLVFEEGSALLTIEDNGTGFDPETLAGPTKASGFGLYGMRERAALLGGTLTIETAPCRGTCITATIPLTNDARSGEPAPQDAEDVDSFQGARS